jgi:hypothetical protein
VWAAEVEPGDVILSGATVEVLARGNDMGTSLAELRDDVRVSSVSESLFWPECVVLRLVGRPWSILARRSSLLRVA